MSEILFLRYWQKRCSNLSVFRQILHNSVTRYPDIHVNRVCIRMKHFEVTCMRKWLKELGTRHFWQVTHFPWSCHISEIEFQCWFICCTDLPKYVFLFLPWQLWHPFLGFWWQTVHYFEPLVQESPSQMCLSREPWGIQSRLMSAVERVRN